MPTIPNNEKIRILNPIPKTNAQNFNTMFFEEKSTLIDSLINYLKNNDHLFQNQWLEICNSSDTLINNISNTLEKTCKSPPILQLTPRTSKQGGYLPSKLSKKWKQHLTTYHTIQKTIRIVRDNPQWSTHPICQRIQSLQHSQIPPPPPLQTYPNEWLHDIAIIAKEANKQARKITTKFAKENIRKAISKYRQLYETSPKKINRRVFKNNESPPLNCITNQQNIILTNPEDIANEIYNQQ